ncbi:MAG: SMP-30/gluconolactonase/LRE family protein [Phycisphaeraceae bacterium]
MPIDTSVEVIADYACKCGENPLWHPQEKRLYWTDIPTGRLFWYDPTTGEHQQCYEGSHVGGFTFQPDGSLLLFRARGNVTLWADGQEQRTLIDEIPDEVTTRFNDVMADPEGRVFAGTMPTKERLGRLYRVDTDGSHHLLLEEIGCANGMGFTLDGRQMYFTDTRADTIWLFDYDRATGAITNQRPGIKTGNEQGGPDGMVVDAEGCIWSAKFGGSGIDRYSPAGEHIGRIDLPTDQITSLIFAGDDLDELYITCAGGGDKDKHGEHAGALFRVRPGVQGRPEHYSRL